MPTVNMTMSPVVTHPPEHNHGNHDMHDMTSSDGMGGGHTMHNMDGMGGHMMMKVSRHVFTLYDMEREDAAKATRSDRKLAKKKYAENINLCGLL